jgi:hypothetical protein
MKKKENLITKGDPNNSLNTENRSKIIGDCYLIIIRKSAACIVP